jgi:Tfp pilus assembly protein PilO
VLTVLGTALIVGFFVIVIYLPGERVCEAARRDIVLANRTIDAMPQRIQFAAEQLKLLQDREVIVRQRDRLLDDENSLHSVLQKVADLARSSGLQVDRTQPLAPITRETYRVMPFQLIASGNFRRVATFLRGLEAQPTLFAVERFSLKSESEQNGEALKADITFSVFVKRATFVDSAEKGDRPTQTQADEFKTAQSDRAQVSFPQSSVTRP